MSDANRDHASIDPFDRLAGLLDGLPGVLATQPKTVLATTPLIGAVEHYIVHTVRQPDVGDTIFLVAVRQRDGKRETIRLAIPAQVADLIARQRDSLGKLAQRRDGRAQADRLRKMAAERKARGEPPAFLKHRRKAGAK